jgi:hypothetical protein
MNSDHSVDNEVNDYLGGGSKGTRDIAFATHNALIANGCHAYFKTIYIGYDLDGEMVAALYKRADHIELALALPEEHESSLLVDATHLTWRTLPVAASFTKSSQLKEVTSLIIEACTRVQSDSHSVYRDNDFFTKHKRRPRP